MANTRVNQFFSNKHAWFYELVLFVAGFMVAFGFTTWFVYGMIKDVFASVSIKAWVTKIKK